MNLKNIKKILLFGFVINCLSCSIDNIEPINLLTEDNVIRDEASAKTVLNRVYNSVGNTLLFNREVTLDVLDFARLSVERQSFIDNDLQDDGPTIRREYISSYYTIQNANFLIELLEAGKAVGISEVRKNEMLSEAKFLRAQEHFLLLINFGEFYNTSSELGIVLQLDPARSDTPFPRNTVQETYDAIIDDLQFAAANGPTGRTTHYLASATTAQALLAKVYLFAGDYPNAATTAQAVINNTDGYSLETNFKDVFTGRYNSQEVLFAPFTGQGGFSIPEVERDFTSRLYFNGNAFPSEAFKAFVDAADGATDDIFDPRYDYVHINPPAPTGGRPMGHGKYTEPFDQGNTLFFLRMAEVYLIAAEAEVRRAGGDLTVALGFLNKVRQRADAGAGVVVDRPLVDKATLLKDIRTEVSLELWNEAGQTWYTTVRYDRLGDINAGSENAVLSNPDAFIMPIPAAALAGNPLLVPNPIN